MIWKPIRISHEFQQLPSTDECPPRVCTELVELELVQEHRSSVDKTADALGLSYRECLDLLRKENIPVVMTPHF